MSGITVSGVFLCTFSSVYPLIDNYNVFSFDAHAKKQKTKNEKKPNRMTSAKLFALDASAKSKYFYKLDIKDLNDNKKLIVT